MSLNDPRASPAPRTVCQRDQHYELGCGRSLRGSDIEPCVGDNESLPNHDSDNATDPDDAPPAPTRDSVVENYRKQALGESGIRSTGAASAVPPRSGSHSRCCRRPIVRRHA
jgi:hypothetical protein